MMFRTRLSSNARKREHANRLEQISKWSKSPKNLFISLPDPNESSLRHSLKIEACFDLKARVMMIIRVFVFYSTRCQYCVR
jgi:hypothetical protein